MEVKLEDYKTIIVNGNKFVLPKRIQQYVIINEVTIAIFVYSQKTDAEYEIKLADAKYGINGGHLFLVKDGKLHQFNVVVSNIWKKDDNTLGIYTGDYTEYLDINKMEIVKSIWNPWGLDNPEKYYKEDKYRHLKKRKR